ncbi:hypothetical protein N7492_009226 [Penicillium capsulatum]|uniref:Amino acid/polyamine transporter I n=1 Tax=Penicillium capsulatum TaxID=69766 RepID=A0A9W9HTK4_9EURO|nr:hypothetical protein N7492_009226 [Penicillium capsulatum]KAJ6106622.1 hypothetical protein N7512_010139 [Penicillium capsulatum]
MAAYEMKSHNASVVSRGEARSSESVHERDNAHLQRMGKKPVLKRNFGILSILGFSCTILGTWEGMLGTWQDPLENGGPGGTIYAFIFGWVGTIALFIVLSELVSMAPTSGGQYHWAAMLAPQSSFKFVSYITAWFAVCGWQCAFAACAFLCGTMIQGAAIMGNAHYPALPWQGTLIVWLALCFALVVNVAGGKLLPRMEAIILVVHILGFFGIVIPLTYMADHRDSHFVFLDFENNGKFATQGLSWFVGMTNCAFAFGGGDAAVHMSEEVANAARVIPNAMMLTVGINGCLGFGMIIAVLFCVGDLEKALNSPTGYPFMEMFYQATNSVPGTLAMTSIMLIIYTCSLMGLLAAASRQFWSFSRDRGVPGWRWWSQISPSRQVPINAIILTVIVSTLLALINIGSSVALSDILSMAVTGVYLSYLMVAVLLLIRRLRGEVTHSNDAEDDVVNVPGAKLVWGPFHCPGIWGVLVNTYAVMYLSIVVFFSVWPSKMNPKYDEMNYAVVGVGSVFILSVVYYFVRARHIYAGPVVEASL